MITSLITITDHLRYLILIQEKDQLGEILQLLYMEINSRIQRTSLANLRIKS